MIIFTKQMFSAALSLLLATTTLPFEAGGQQSTTTGSSGYAGQGARFTFYLLFAAAVTLLAVGKARAQATGDIQINVSNTNVCDGSVPTPPSFVVYAQNKNTSRPISATLQYDTVPTSGVFSVYDAGLTPTQEGFPKSLVVRVPAGATVPVSCKYTYRTWPSTNQVSNIELVVTLTDGAYINPNDPPLPPEDARSFAYFMNRGGFLVVGTVEGHQAYSIW